MDVKEESKGSPPRTEPGPAMAIVQAMDKKEKEAAKASAVKSPPAAGVIQPKKVDLQKVQNAEDLKNLMREALSQKKKEAKIAEDARNKEKALWVQKAKEMEQKAKENEKQMEREREEMKKQMEEGRKRMKEMEEKARKMESLAERAIKLKEKDKVLQEEIEARYLKAQEAQAERKEKEERNDWLQEQLHQCKKNCYFCQKGVCWVHHQIPCWFCTTEKGKKMGCRTHNKDGYVINEIREISRRAKE